MENNMISKVKLENFILKLGFIFDKTQCSRWNKLNISDIKVDNDISEIKGTVTLNMANDKMEVITFETLFTQSDSRLRFESEYQILSFDSKQKPNYVGDGIYMTAVKSNKTSSEDTFLILDQVENSDLDKLKGKFLVHISDGIIKQLYSVSQNYEFNKNGISDSFTLLSMSDKRIVESVNQACGIRSRRGK